MNYLREDRDSNDRISHHLVRKDVTDEPVLSCFGEFPLVSFCNV